MAEQDPQHDQPDGDPPPPCVICGVPSRGMITRQLPRVGIIIPGLPSCPDCSDQVRQIIAGFVYLSVSDDGVQVLLSADIEISLTDDDDGPEGTVVH